jgi:hypothetical protein
MKIVWRIDRKDVKKVRAFFCEHRETPFVKMRTRKNLRKRKPPVTRAKFWMVMVGCLLSTQQRSGPDTPVSRFLRTRPFPLSYGICLRQRDLAAFAGKVLRKAGGLRRSTVIGRELAENRAFLKEGGWAETFTVLEAVRLKPRPEAERKAAGFIDERFRGFGPKQSRNLLQGLGLSRYEIPIDSRITQWLNDFGFPVKLTANSLADRSYYNFVSDGFQQLCAACQIMPCVLDAAIFSSFDKGGWTEKNLVW